MSLELLLVILNQEARVMGSSNRLIERRSLMVLVMILMTMIPNDDDVFDRLCWWWNRCDVQFSNVGNRWFEKVGGVLAYHVTPLVKMNLSPSPIRRIFLSFGNLCERLTCKNVSSFAFPFYLSKFDIIHAHCTAIIILDSQNYFSWLSTFMYMKIRCSHCMVCTQKWWYGGMVVSSHCRQLGIIKS